MNTDHEQQRWLVIGRLTASLFHEINNPMQAISGAMSLALEEIDNPEALRAYVGLTLQESDRVIRLIARVRRIYRSEQPQPELIDVNELVQEVLALVQKKLKRARLRVETHLSSGVPPITAVFSDLALAILCPLLQMVDALPTRDENGRLLFRTCLVENDVRVTFRIDHTALSSFRPDLSWCRSLIETYQGDLRYEDSESVCLTFHFPSERTPTDS